MAELKELLANLQPRRRPGQWAFCSTTTRRARALETAPVALFREEEGVTVVVPQNTADAAGLGSGTPFHPHNHCPSVTWCPNGDLLAVWFSTIDERGREMTILGSRLRAGGEEWEPASEFFKAPDRNMTGSALFHDGGGTIYHANGLEASGHWANPALVMRTSRDNGAMWSRPVLANPEHQPRNQVISGMSATREGWLIQPCDAVHGGSGGTAIHVSRDHGQTWVDPGAGTAKPDFEGDAPGGTIAGIHAGVVQLLDGRLLAFGRGDSRKGACRRTPFGAAAGPCAAWLRSAQSPHLSLMRLNRAPCQATQLLGLAPQSGSPDTLPGDDMSIGERMPQSVSEDMGRSWRYSASSFPPIGGGQRPVLTRLRQGPLLLVCFTDSSQREEPVGMGFTSASGAGASGAAFTGYGMFAALSYDEGGTWPVRKLLTDGRARELDGGAWTRAFPVDATHAEPRGYLAATQTPDQVVHLISRRLHYRFNLEWLREGE